MMDSDQALVSNTSNPKDSWKGPLTILFVFVLFLIFFVSFITPVNYFSTKVEVNEHSAVNNLKSIKVAQDQYFKRYSAYSISGNALGADSYISPDFKDAFESYNNNGDHFKASKAGYVYRLIFKKGNTKSGTPEWICISKPSVPGTTGEFQFVILNNGEVYRKSNRAPKDWLLDAIPIKLGNDWEKVP